jgi:hypothetical protein
VMEFYNGIKEGPAVQKLLDAIIVVWNPFGYLYVFFLYFYYFNIF